VVVFKFLIKNFYFVVLRLKLTAWRPARQALYCLATSQPQLSKKRDKDSS
jgi:hypothetical protein